jgi:hypothetical protein
MPLSGRKRPTMPLSGRKRPTMPLSGRKRPTMPLTGRKRPAPCRAEDGRADERAAPLGFRT